MKGSSYSLSLFVIPGDGGWEVCRNWKTGN